MDPLVGHQTLIVGRIGRFAVLVVMALQLSTGALAMDAGFTLRTVMSGLKDPFEITMGPDGKIWFTERVSGNVGRVDPQTGVSINLLSLEKKVIAMPGGAGGLMGLALHPHLLNGKPYVYLMYTYGTSGNRFNRVERYVYDTALQRLDNPVIVIDELPASEGHNGGRLAIGPDDKLYLSIGDMVNEQHLKRLPNRAQDPAIYVGKILRLNLEPQDGSWIPADNPFGNATYSIGHRNPQGLVWASVNGIAQLYSSEHGPYSDDELNLITKGGNYGWPLVAGHCEGNYDGRLFGLSVVASEKASCLMDSLVEPIASFYNAPFPPDERTDWLQWPTIAPSGLDYYGATSIPGWQNSLLIPALKAGMVVRVKLSDDGKTVASVDNLFRNLGRFRDICIDPGGTKIYVATDSSGPALNSRGQAMNPIPHRSSILEFSYTAAPSLDTP